MRNPCHVSIEVEVHDDQVAASSSSGLKTSSGVLQSAKGLGTLADPSALIGCIKPQIAAFRPPRAAQIRIRKSARLRGFLNG